jgi:hypothetical protein
MSKSIILFVLTFAMGAFVESGILVSEAGDEESDLRFHAFVQEPTYLNSISSSILFPASSSMEWESSTKWTYRNKSGLTILGFFSGLTLFCGFVFSDYRKRKKNVKSLEIQLKQLEMEIAMLNSVLDQQLAEKEEIKAKIEFTNRSLTTCTLNLAQKDTLFSEIRNLISESVKRPNYTEVNLRKVLRMIDTGKTNDQNWEGFKTWFEQIHPEFYRRLKEEFPKLSNSELRLCALIRLSLNSKECARILGISPDSVKVARHRIRKKMNIEYPGNLVELLSGYDVNSVSQYNVTV